MPKCDFNKVVSFGDSAEAYLEPLTIFAEKLHRDCLTGF